MNETETLSQNETDDSNEADDRNEAGAGTGPVSLRPVPTLQVPAQPVPAEAGSLADPADDRGDDLDDDLDDDAVIEGTIVEDEADEDEAGQDAGPGLVAEDALIEGGPVQDTAAVDTTVPDGAVDDVASEEPVIEGVAAVEDPLTGDVAADVATEDPLTGDVAADVVTEDPLTGDLAVEEVAVGEVRPPAYGDEGPFLTDTEELRSDWSRIRGGFVDNPRDSVAQAETVIDEVINRLVAALRARQGQTHGTWAGDTPDTESLRQALLTYQALFNRIADL